MSAARRWPRCGSRRRAAPAWWSMRCSTRPARWWFGAGCPRCCPPASRPAPRAPALEYLESILPADVRIQLWPLLEPETTAVGAAVAGAALSEGHTRSKDELVAALNLAYQTIRAARPDKRSPQP